MCWPGDHIADRRSMALGIGLIHYESELARRDETISQQAERIKELEAEIEQLKRLLADKATSKASKKPKFTENYSLDKNTHKTRHHAGSTGRRSHEAKRDLISDSQPIYWKDVDPEECVCHREQFAWRLVAGRAVYLRYCIYDVPDSKQLPVPPGLRNSRSEFGIEIILVLAFLHYWIGVSIDHAREIMRFFSIVSNNGWILSKRQEDLPFWRLSRRH